MVSNSSTTNLHMKKTIKSLINDAFRDITSLGGFVFYGMILLYLLVTSSFSIFYDLILALLFSLGIVVLIRSFYFKNRPKKESYQNYIEKINASSFPSLHTARSIFLGIYFITLTQNFFLEIAIGIVSLLVAYSRYHIKKHDTWDIIGGVILGVVTFWITSVFSLL